eukprot:jgi/Picsp_1/3962/NSC_01474-R1_carbohydratebinding protein
MALRGVSAGAEVLACLILILRLLAIVCDGRKIPDEPVPKSLIADVTNGVQDAIQGGLEVAKDAIENLKGQFEASSMNDASVESGISSSMLAPAPESGSLPEGNAIQSLKGQFEGDGTAYSEEVEDGSNFACSYRTLPDKAKTNFVAINLPQWDEGRACGKCVNVWCTDPFCTTQFEPVKLMVVDLCPECKQGDLDLSIPAYEQVTGRWPHRLKVEWEWSDCGEWFDDDDEIRMDIKDGSNDWWRGFFFSNSRYPLSSVSINGRVLERQEYNFWTDRGELEKGPYKIALTASTGETIETTVDDVLKMAQSIGAQFSLRSGSSVSTTSSMDDTSVESGISSSMLAPAPESGSLPEGNAIQSLKGQFEGDGTAYSEEVEDGSNFACSYRTLPDKAKTNFVAINLPQWDEGRACGKCVNVWCTDPFCTTQFEPVKLMVVDLCPECKQGDLDLSIPAYEQVTGRWPHRLKVEWEWSDCGEWFDDNDEIRMDIKDGSNDWWRGFFFSNSRYPLSSVSINGRVLERQEYNFWTDRGELEKGPYKIALTASTGETIETTVDDVLKMAQSIGAQFSLRSGSSVSTTSSMNNSLPEASKVDCKDTPTKDDFTCQQHKGWGNCDKDWLINDGLCAKTCGRCKSEAQFFEILPM